MAAQDRVEKLVVQGIDRRARQSQFVDIAVADMVDHRVALRES
jgi:hypothetical protein